MASHDIFNFEQSNLFERFGENYDYFSQQGQQAIGYCKSINGKIYPVGFVNEVYLPYPLDPRILVSNYGNLFSTYLNKYLDQYERPWDGYVIASHKSQRIYVHIAVARTFLLNSPYYGIMVNHLDGIKSHNWVWNLEWCDNKANIQHAYRTGLCKGNSRNDPDNLWFNDEQKHQICKMIQDKVPTKKIAEVIGVPFSRKFTKLISKVRNKDRWADISKDYVFESALKTDEEIHKICQLLDSGMESKDVARVLGMELDNRFYTLIHDLRAGKRFPDIVSQYPNVKRVYKTDQEAEYACKRLVEGISPQMVAYEMGYEYDDSFKSFISGLVNGKTFKYATTKYPQLLNMNIIL